MKKIISFIIVLGIFFLVFQFSINFLKTKHNIDYNIETSNRKINVHEEYYKEKKVEYYFFKVKLDDREFVFDSSNIFNKQKKVISDMKIYEEDNLLCISPIYVKNNSVSDIFCNIGNEQYSYSSVPSKYNLESFTKELNGFSDENYETSNESTTISGNTVYKENMYHNEFIIVYNYDELVKIIKPSYQNIKFADYDIYQNELGVMIDKYYILPMYENKPEYSGLLIIDVLEGKKYDLIFADRLSTNLYINGIVDGKLYLFDKSNLVQYEIDPQKRIYRIIGNKDTNAQYYDGRWSTKNIYEFSKQELKFIYKYPIKDNYVEAFETDKFYYYYNNDNRFYKVYKKDLTKRIFLFKYNAPKEVRVINDRIYFINNNTLYRYDDYGLKKILTNNEFKYNYNNIYGVYFE